jgi:general secretion pathway protein F
VTTLLFGLADAVGRYAPVTVIAIAVLLVGVWRLSKRDDVKRVLARVRMTMPVLGPLSRALAAARFCRMLGTLLGNGVPMIASMEIARESAGNVLMEETIERATEAVRAGDKLAEQLADGGLFDEDVVEMISVAESANNLDEVLLTIAETIERRVERLLSAAVTLIEPLLIVAMACVIAFVAAGLILPMVELSASA